MNSISKGLVGGGQQLGKVRALSWEPGEGKREADSSRPVPTSFSLLPRSALGAGEAQTLSVPWILC